MSNSEIIYNHVLKVSNHSIEGNGIELFSIKLAGLNKHFSIIDYVALIFKGIS
jgi:hypothetical protein